MLALLAIAVLIPLLYIPGYLIGLALLGAAPPPDPLERHYERVVAGALLNGWLAFTLAELGIFSIWLHLSLLALLALGCGLIAARRGVLSLPHTPLGIIAHRAAAGANLRARLATNWDVLAFAALGIVVAVLVARPFESVLGARDAGVYADTGFAIARTGGMVQHDALVAQIGQDKGADNPSLRAAAAQAETNFLGVQDRDRFIATRLRAGGFFIYEGDLINGRVIPQFFHLYPAWIALLAGLLGLQGGLFATGLMGFLGVWSVGMLGRRLAGRWVGLLAALFLALNGVQVWFSRYTTSESTAQFLTFAGLYAFAVSQARPAAAESRPRPGGALLSCEQFAALLSGVAFGQLALTRVEFFLLIAPLVGYLGYTWLTRRWTQLHTLMAGGLSLLLAQAALHITLIARDYFFNTLFARLQDQSAIIATLSLPFLTPALRRVFFETPRSVLRNPSRLWIELALLGGLVLACYLIRRDGRPLRLIERAIPRWRVLLLRCSALAILLLAAYGYLIRPQLLSAGTLAALPGCVAPAQLSQPTGDCLALQGYVGAPIRAPEYPNQVAYALATLPARLTGHTPPPRTSPELRLNDKIAIYQSNMVRFGWYLSPLGVVLGLAGFVLWWRRGMDRAGWLFLALALLASVFFLRQSYGTSEATYIYILRRYVPQVYPAFCLGIAYALVALAHAGSSYLARGASSLRRRLSMIGAAALAAGMIGFLIVTGRPIYRHVEYGGALTQLAALAQRFGPDDVLLLRGGAPTYAAARDMPDLVATPLTYGFGLNALTIKSEEPGHYAEQLADYIRRWQAQGRQVYLALGASGAVGLPGFRLEPIGRADLRLDEFEQLQNQKPSNVQLFDLDFALYRVEPAPAATSAGPAAIGVDDYAAQVRGFYHPEQIGATRVDWTDGDALLRIPWAPSSGPRSLTIRLAAGVRPPKAGSARTCLSVRPETSFWVEDPTAVYRPLGCFDPDEAMADYTLVIDPSALPPSTTGTALLRIESSAWVPALIDTAGTDGRALGVQFGGLTIGSADRR